MCAVAATVALLLEVALTLRESIGRLCDDVVAEVFAGVPPLTSDPALRAAVVEGVSAAVDQLLELLADVERPIDEDPPEEVLALAGALVARGADPAGLVRAARIGQDTVWRWLLDDVMRREPPGPALGELLALASTRLFTRTDVVVERILRRWMMEHERTAAGALARRRELIERLLAGDAADPREASACLGYDLEREHCAAVLWDRAEPDPEQARAKLEAVAAVLARAAGAGSTLTLPGEDGALRAWFGSGSRLDLDAVAAAAEEVLGSGQGVALGTPGRGLAGFREAHGEALGARRIADLSRRPSGVVRYDEVEAVSLMAEDLGRLGRFVQRTLGDLAERGEQTARLRGTLRLWLSSGGSAPAAAARLGVHKNTVLYRVHRAGALLPRPLEEDRLGVELALAAVEAVGLDALHAGA